MKYDFETVVDQTTKDLRKWKQMYDWNPDVEPGIIPFSVTDMELVYPPELIEGLKNYLDETTFGYTNATDSYYNAVKGWLSRRHNWEIEDNWIVYTPGVVFAFYEAIKAFSEQGDGILTMSPVYHLFYRAIQRTEA